MIPSFRPCRPCASGRAARGRREGRRRGGWCLRIQHAVLAETPSPAGRRGHRTAAAPPRGRQDRGEGAAISDQALGAGPAAQTGGAQRGDTGGSRQRAARAGGAQRADMAGSAQRADRRDLAVALRKVISGEVRFDAYSRRLFSRDASMYAIEPLGVVFPRHADDVAAVISTAADFGLPLLPRGAGTSLAGQAVGKAVVMDLSRHISPIIALDAERRLARVQPGVVQAQLNLAAARHGLMFGPDTSTSNPATLGGMIGNNSAGSHSVRYGMTIDHVLALDVVLSDASRAGLRPLSEAERVGRAARPTLEGAICRDLPGLAERNRAAIAAGFPRYWRQSGGYRLGRPAPAPAHPPAHHL